MTVTIKSAIQVIESHLNASGYFPGGVSVGEPSDPPSDDFASIFMGNIEHASTTLNGTIERRTWIIRLYVKAFREPRWEIEYLLDEMYADIMTRLLGDYTLGGNVRNIEPLNLRLAPAYQTVGGTVFRLADISVPMLVDDSATYAE